MSLANIKAQLVALEQTVTGVQRVFADEPDRAPIAADCPAVINAPSADGFPEISMISVATVRYDWHFDILFLLKPLGQGSPVEWDDAIEPYAARFIAKFLSALTLNGNCVDQRLRAAFRVGAQINYLDQPYYGFVLPWTVSEDVLTAVTP